MQERATGLPITTPFASTLLASALLASVAWAQDARECTPAPYLPQLMTPAAGELPPTGALVVGFFPGGSGSSTALPPMALARGRRSTALRSEIIAPGLHRVIPETTRLAGRYELTGLATATELHFRRSTLAAAPVAPALERAERYLVASARGERLEVRAHFAFPMPQGVVAVVSYFGDDDEADVFARAAPTQPSVVLFTSEGGCPLHPPGTRAPAAGARVRVAFVDLHGQISRLSEARTIE